MIPQHATATQQADAHFSCVGVGIDTSRYGHYAAFLREDLSPVAGELPFVESAAGYAQLRQRFERIVAKLGLVCFLVRLDAAADRCINDLAQQLGERYTPARASLKEFRIDDEKGDQAAALQRLREFIDNMENVLRAARGLPWAVMITRSASVTPLGVGLTASHALIASIVSGQTGQRRLRPVFGLGKMILPASRSTARMGSVPQSALPNPQFMPSRNIARKGKLAASIIRWISSAVNSLISWLTFSTRKFFLLGRLNPGPNCTGLSIICDSTPYLKMLRTP
jgi:hypothetical protein